MPNNLGLSLYMGLIMSGYQDYYLSVGLKITDYGTNKRVIILGINTLLYIDLENNSYSTDNSGHNKLWTLITKDTLGYLRALTED